MDKEFQTYKEQLADSRWEDFRQKILIRDGHKCRCCGKQFPNLDIHHLTYHGKLWEANNCEVISLCRNCHAKLHSFLSATIPIHIGLDDIESPGGISYIEGKEADHDANMFTFDRNYFNEKFDKNSAHYIVMQGKKDDGLKRGIYWQNGELECEFLQWSFCSGYAGNGVLPIYYSTSFYNYQKLWQIFEVMGVMHHIVWCSIFQFDKESKQLINILE
jgi:hypothetical protein